MTISDTQMASWQAIAKELGERQNDVYQFILENNGAAAFEIAEFLHLPLHSISGRVTELHQMGRICDSGLRIFNDSTKRKVIVWTAHTQQLKFIQNGKGA